MPLPAGDWSKVGPGQIKPDQIRGLRRRGKHFRLLLFQVEPFVVAADGDRTHGIDLVVFDPPCAPDAHFELALPIVDAGAVGERTPGAFQVECVLVKMICWSRGRVAQTDRASDF